MEKVGPAFLFDLDGTLVDSVYQHVLAWREALEVAGIELAVWRIHRRIGVSGGLFVNALLRETGQQLSAEEVMRLQRSHEDVYLRLANLARPLPGAVDLLAHFSAIGVPWAIATSGELHVADFGRPNKLLLEMFREAGFEQNEECARYATIFGELRLWRARRPVEATQGKESCGPHFRKWAYRRQMEPSIRF
ncbi:MAG TPA: HAD family hydrolase [Blastocatellia bacterium]|nr:HAD family hydrolase [Blastocatellia bacterium]